MFSKRDFFAKDIYLSFLAKCVCGICFHVQLSAEECFRPHDGLTVIHK